MKKYSRNILTFTISLSTALLGTHYAIADSSNMNIHLDTSLPKATIVADNDLDKMHGRFLDGNVIRFFGLEMVTYWKTPEGTLTAGVGLNADLNNPNQPLIDYRPIAQVNLNGLPAAGTGQVSNNGALDSVNGISQSIQVAGNNNDLHNSLSIDILDVSSPTPSGFSNQFNQANSQSLGTSASANFQGATAIASANNQEFMTQVTIPGQGTAMQYLRHTSFDSINSLGQSMMVTGNNNNVENAMKLTVQLDSQQALQQASEQASQWLKSMNKF